MNSTHTWGPAQFSRQASKQIFGSCSGLGKAGVTPHLLQLSLHEPQIVEATVSVARLFGNARDMAHAVVCQVPKDYVSAEVCEILSDHLIASSELCGTKTADAGCKYILECKHGHKVLRS